MHFFCTFYSCLVLSGESRQRSFWGIWWHLVFQQSLIEAACCLRKRDVRIKHVMSSCLIRHKTTFSFHKDVYLIYIYTGRQPKQESFTMKPPPPIQYTEFRHSLYDVSVSSSSFAVSLHVGTQQQPAVAQEKHLICVLWWQNKLSMWILALWTCLSRFSVSCVYRHIWWHLECEVRKGGKKIISLFKFLLSV